MRQSARRGHHSLGQLPLMSNDKSYRNGEIIMRQDGISKKSEDVHQPGLVGPIPGWEFPFTLRFE